MNKKKNIKETSLLILAIIILLLIIGVITVVSLNKKEKNSDGFNPYELTTYYEYTGYEETYLNSDDDKIIIKHPNNIHNYLNYDVSLQLLDAYTSTEQKISVEITTAKYDNIDVYLERMFSIHVTKELTSETGFFDDLQYTNIIQDEINGKTFKYFAYAYEFLDKKTVYYILASQIDQERILTVEINVKDGLLSYDAIKQIMDYELLEGKREKLKYEEENGYYIGNISTKKYGQYNTGYKLNFQIKNDYTLNENNSYKLQYVKESLNKKTSVITSFYVGITSSETIEEKIVNTLENYQRYNIENYTQSPETYRNVKQTGIRQKTINNKNIYYYIIEYDYYLKNGEYSTKYYTSYVIEKVDEKIYISNFINTIKTPITNELIGEIINYSIEEY